MAALFLRRAFALSLVPLAARTARSSSSYLFASRLLPFSTHPPGGIPDKSPEDSYDNTVEKCLQEVDSSSSERLPLPSDYPFDISIGDNVASMWRSHGTDEIVDIKINGNDPLIRMDVDIRTWSVDFWAKITPKPDQLHIHEITVRDLDGNMGNYREYLQTKGLKPETISFLFGLLVSNEARA